MSADDGIEIRVRYWPTFVPERIPFPWAFRFEGDPGLYMVFADTVTRIDGGDPGDEDDGK